MKKYALENVHDGAFDECFYRVKDFWNAVLIAYEDMLNDWVKEGIITEQDRNEVLDNFENQEEFLFKALLG